jgi:hypothetical protein
LTVCFGFELAELAGEINWTETSSQIYVAVVIMLSTEKGVFSTPVMGSNGDGASPRFIKPR